MSATAMPAATAARRPTQGLPAKWVTTAAVKAPASISPSKAMLITPERSEKSPPRAARSSGVVRRMAEERSSIRKRSRMSHLPFDAAGASGVGGPGAPPGEPAAAEDLLGRHEEDDHRLEHLHQVLRDVLGED